MGVIIRMASARSLPIESTRMLGYGEQGGREVRIQGIVAAQLITHGMPGTQRGRLWRQDTGRAHQMQVFFC